MMSLTGLAAQRRTVKSHSRRHAGNEDRISARASAPSRYPSLRASTARSLAGHAARGREADDDELFTRNRVRVTISDINEEESAARLSREFGLESEGKGRTERQRSRRMSSQQQAVESLYFEVAFVPQ